VGAEPQFRPIRGAKAPASGGHPANGSTSQAPNSIFLDPSEVPPEMNDTPETTLLSMFWTAHPVVKVVMIGLLAASFWCWTIIVNKTLLFRRFRSEMDGFEQVFWSGQSLEELYQSLQQKPNTGAATLFVSAMREWKRSFQNPASSFRGLHARLDKVLDVSIAREVERLESNLLFLATVASAGPFVGLFGTVWGIMTSFRSIAASKNTSLAVVAPGIAEALLATAIGLFAAIPALIAYNKLQGDVARAQARMESFADEFSSILSRQIDQHLPGDKAA
jgi:biopolymer transport protein TolQ